VGREAELTALEQRLGEGRLVTLTGPGGCGKSRLALRTAARLAGRFDGVQLVELAPLADGALVPATVAAALGLKDHAGASVVDTVAHAVGDDRLLLVIDNCEHLVHEVAELAVQLLERCGRISVLATSRQRLQAPGELVFPVQPLALPSSHERSVDAVASAEAVMLFVERARAAEPSFALTDDNAPAVAEICTRLDGIPLAIELAAARVSVLTPAGIATHLDDRFELLGGGRGGPARHQTLRALVQWSYDTLTDAQRRLLARLSVFRDSFDLAAVEYVAGTDPARFFERTVGPLSDLVDRSLIQVRHDGDARYALLETIRGFAAQRLFEMGDEAAARRLHLEWAMEVARSADDQLRGPEWRQGASRLADERGNLRAALAWALDGGAPSIGRELAARLARWWFVSGRYSEGRQFLARALAGADDEPVGIRARLYVGAGWCAYHLGDGDDAELLGRQGLELAEAAGDDLLAAWAGVLLAGLAWSAGNGSRVRDLLADAAEWSEAPATAPLAARAAVLLSNVAFVAGDLAEARRLGELAVAHARTAPGTENLALALICSAHPALVAGDLDTAATLIGEALATARAASDRFAEVIACYQRAWLCSVRGDAKAAAEEAGRCWAVGRTGAVRLVDALAPVADAAAALARGYAVDAQHALGRAVAGGRAMGFVAFVPGWLAERACLAAHLGDEVLAENLMAEAQPLVSAPGERLTAATVAATSAILAWRRGDLAGAERLAREALATWHGAGAFLDAADGVELLGALACQRGRWNDGVRLLAAAVAVRGRLGYRGRRPVSVRDAAMAARAAAEEAVGAEAFALLEQDGTAMGLDAAVEYAQRRGGGRKRPGAGWASLTPTERQVADLVTEGLRNEAIARRLYVTPGTVKNHLSHIFAKLGVESRGELLAVALRRGDDPRGRSA
jgi:predicted ATPase/DNA-binding CsgD family transcriptional regulator